MVNFHSGKLLCSSVEFSLNLLQLTLFFFFFQGAMGAGKSYTMRKLVENNHFPLLAFITVRVRPSDRRGVSFRLHPIPDNHCWLIGRPRCNSKTFARVSSLC